MDESRRREVGREIRARAQGRHHAVLADNLTALDSELGTMADDFVFGRIWAREGLAFQDRMLVAIVALAATGNTDQLRNYLHGALQDGIEVERVHEALTMLVVYCGFPTGLKALALLSEVRESHERQPTSTTLKSGNE